VKVELESVNGACDRAALDRALGAYSQRLGFCLFRQMAGDPEPAAPIGMSATITSRGRIKRSELGSALSPRRQACLRRMFARMRFPPPLSGTCEVRFSLGVQEPKVKGIVPPLADLE
jgi:hypothetical protein